MLDWFEKQAPIRLKFTTLLLILTALAAVGLATTALAVFALLPGFVLLPVAALGVAGTALTVRLASSCICLPYADTVVRMEALAAGDTDSPLAYTDHTDCVGRMTVAMATFRDNARAIRDLNDVQNKVVEALSDALTALASKRLDCRIEQTFPDRYEPLRADFNRAVDVLAGAITIVDRTAESVQNGSDEIHSATSDLSQRNENQAASLEEASAAMDQVTQTVNVAAKAAQAARELIATAHQEALEGDSVVENAIKAMGAIETSASEIGTIVDVIDSIAFQTNLLALNAGVEAARAGDAGKGFAVVANEVRALAQRSADAARDIGALIQASSLQVASGVQLVGETGILLSNIVTRIREVNTQVSGIAESAQKQAENLMQVNATVGDIDRVTQQNAAMVEQASAATRTLSDEAHRLSQIVKSFRLAPGREVVTALSAPAPRPGPQATAPRPQPLAARAANHALAPAALAYEDACGDDWDAF
ncbi:methyl-accepting chemotaxis protein [Novosphingobium sp. 1949]|uniref:Methyl-accepting chemotaxis protein n=1 Tax=Novosphingobium organovorum TaxID=2930092 RepID=A0ABT0BFE7_9SPHN|nr:methyl-accepting chemotaxis protein [Novosphingobium organovorum]MCJ2183778.1 methyl-accepting chemotaxis protein [Novosphingobium organovorum]